MYVKCDFKSISYALKSKKGSLLIVQIYIITSDVIHTAIISLVPMEKTSLKVSYVENRYTLEPAINIRNNAHSHGTTVIQTGILL